ncbi:MAG: hypothetical protein WCF65_08575 [Parachlamydiaceae bacterium]
MQHRLIFFLLVFPTYLAAVIQLQFIPSAPVQQTNRLTIDVQESLPILNMTSQGSQLFKFDLVATNRPVAAELTFPAMMTLTIRDVSLRTRTGGQDLSFDLRSATNSPSLNAFAHLANQPLNLFIDAHGQVDSKNETFERLLKQYPALSQVPLDSLVKDLASGLFALYKEDLSVGAKIEMESSQGPIFAIPAFLTYEITDINDKEIVASLSGKINPSKIFLEKPVQIDGKRPQQVEMTISGTLQGRVTWQRKNAMLYGGNCDYSYEAKLRAGERRWTMKMNISQTTSSTSL